MPGGINALLPVERQVIHILGRDNLREQPRRGEAAVLEGLQGRGDGCGKGLVAPHVGGSHDTPPQEARLARPPASLVPAAASAGS